MRAPQAGHNCAAGGYFFPAKTGCTRNKTPIFLLFFGRFDGIFKSRRVSISYFQKSRIPEEFLIPSCARTVDEGAVRQKGSTG